MGHAAEKDLPTRRQAILFRGKVACFRLRRHLTDLRDGCRQRFPRDKVESDLPVLAESRSLLYASSNAAEFDLQAGKVHNLRVAARHLNGVTVPAGKIFSFWAHVPRPTRRRGFVDGRELREGCIVPSIGGGLCQLSNALYDAALKAGLEIVERHAHSRLVPGSMAEQGRDATIFWNYVDLQFRSNEDTEFQLEVLLGRGELVVRIRAEDSKIPQSSAAIPGTPSPAPAGDPVESCETCGVTECFRHPQTLGLSQTQSTAWLVDAYWPEYDHYLQQHRGGSDSLFVPLSNRLGNRPTRYPWSTEGFATVRQALLQTLKRSLLSRRLAAQGADRQRALLKMDEQIARSYARRIPHTATHLIVSQNLLPFLWQDGVLGGRSFDVLMTRLPMHKLQATLDQAAATWPDSLTLTDFRADPELVAMEKAALDEARHWITPHSQIAELGGDRSIELDWNLPQATPRENPPAGQGRLLFPASTLGRKGCWEIRSLKLPIALCGPNLERSDFWEGADVEQRDYRSALRSPDISTVVEPAWVENNPRRLLQAVAAGVPVIASANCGLKGVRGVCTVPIEDLQALRNAIDQVEKSAATHHWRHAASGN